MSMRQDGISYHEWDGPGSYTGLRHRLAFVMGLDDARLYKNPMIVANSMLVAGKLRLRLIGHWTQWEK